MTTTLALAWWHGPAAASIIALLWLLYWPVDDSGYLGGMVRFFMAVPALAVIAIVWIVGGVLK